MAYREVMRLRYRGTSNARRIVAPSTDIVIEGFPRCANSFAVRAFRMDNDTDPDRPLRIATHMHSPAQVLLAVRWKIPTLVLIRHPDDAVVSFPALAVQLNKHGLADASESFMAAQISYWTQRYTQFYTSLLPVRDKIVVADFSETTSDFGAVVERLNKQTGSTFAAFEHTVGNVEHIFANSKEHLSPSPQRDLIKREFKDLYMSHGRSLLRQRAIQIFEAFSGISGLDRD